MRTLHEHRATVYTHTVSSRSCTQRAAVRDSPGQTGKRSTVVTLTKAFDLCVADCTISHCTCLSSSLTKPCFCGFPAIKHYRPQPEINALSVEGEENPGLGFPSMSQATLPNTCTSFLFCLRVAPFFGLKYWQMQQDLCNRTPL